jgi:hypothetical protein
MASRRTSTFINSAAVAGLLLLSLPFAIYAIDRGFSAGNVAEQAASRFFLPDAPVATALIYGHMVAGGLLTLLAPLQLLSVVRRRWPVLHRGVGYAVAGMSLLSGIFGLVFILSHGTIGGRVMDLGFGLYGILLLCSAARTVVMARRRDPRHRLWAERLVILALAAWLYRVHYGLWEIATGGAGVRADFSGPFDLVQVFAFYLPYLLIHALWRRWRGLPDRLEA